MDRLITFERITIEPPLKAIYRRLGYRKGLTQVRPDEARTLGDRIEQARALITLKGAARRLPILSKDSRQIRLPGDRILESTRLAALLKDSREVILLGATAGPAVIEAIRRDTAENNLTRAVVLDAAASEMVDAALDWMETFFGRQLRREGRRLTRSRFSCGYGDLALENQKLFYELLELGRLGVELTERYILVPEKSVTAAAGIETIA
ncbi:MAG: Vitamin B12 dependent methionine synthase, activation domain [Syntrophaceae bacterium PtaB.Bin038]|nr:MAG: Vitamin B12 dependent methionine synthase, activation domain [Syntrophaceae bacterium PtaB.Bin038]